MPGPRALREMRETDEELASIDALLTVAYGTPSRRAELDLYAAVRPARWCVIEGDGRLLAVAGGLGYGAFAWLGLVATHPDARGQGLAKHLSQHLVEWALAQGCTTVALDASLDGLPVYERLGFTTVGGTAELWRPAGVPAPPGARAARASQADLDEIVAFDAARFGGDRETLLRALAGRADATWHVTRSRAGTISGFVVARGQHVGPAAAVDVGCARRLLRAALDRRIEQRVLVPHGSAHLATLLELGFVERRQLAHMRIGELALSPRRSDLIAQLAYATG